MSGLLVALRPAAAKHSPNGSYRAGQCNIGPAEIARRRTAGHTGLVASVVLLALLIALDAPPGTRFLVAIPAAGSAVGYLQAWLRFCAAFGLRGVLNFGELGRTSDVADRRDRARDRHRAVQITLASLAIGGLVGLLAVLLPT